MKTLLLQNVSTVETRTVKQAVALSNKDEYNVVRVDIDSLLTYWEVDPSYIPVGSVEFVRAFMEVSGIKEPEINPYPITERKFLHRKVYSGKCPEEGIWFIKPKKLKLFNGFVYDASKPYLDFTAYEREQIDVMLENVHQEYWISEAVDFLSEWRYYIDRGQILGYARYDEEGEDDAPEPEIDSVKEYVDLLELIYYKGLMNHPYVLDFGVLSTGETALVEYNAPWAIGLYGGALTPKQYLKFLIDGWEQSVLNI